MKPILFNTEMVQAILDGRKTVTRRVVKPQPILYGLLEPCWNWYGIKTPYEIGDILYVRETWKPIEASCPPSHCTIEYKAGGTKEFDEIIAVPQHITSWRPSIHMPKEAARIFLRVTDVRVERLQDITEEQAISEGIEKHPVAVTNASDIFEYYIPGTKKVCITACGAFSHLWDLTIPKHPNKFKRYPYYWNDNPWVWVIEFERISKKEAYDVR